MRPSFLASLGGALFVSTAVLFGQCKDPKPSRDGFAWKFDKDKSVTFSDGYRTLANVLYPSATPGPCGWPLLVLVHGLSGSRNTPSAEAVGLAGAGYAVVAYDVRAQADARRLNPGRGSTLWALDEWIDLAEIIEWAAKEYPGRIDPGRTAVFGDSQGAVHAWAAAAYSGRRLPSNSRRTQPFPRIQCVVARFFPPDVVDMMVPDDSSIQLHLPGLAFDANHPIVDLDATYKTNVAGYLDRNDPEGLASYLRSIPGKDFRAEMRSSAVPTFAIMGLRDDWVDANQVVDLFERMPPTTPRRLYLTVGPHGEPRNINQGFRLFFLTESWLRRFLKGNREPFEKGPRYLVASTPVDYPTLSSQTSLWRHRMDSVWPPSRTNARRYYLRDSGRLSLASPGPEGSTLIPHRVASDYTVRSYRVDAGDFATVTKSIPLVSYGFTTQPFSQHTELATTPRVNLLITPTLSRFMVAARLVAIAPDDSELLLARGALAVKQATGPRPQRVEFAMTPVNAVIPAGYRLRFEVRNLDVQTSLQTDMFRRIPLFASYAIRIQHEARASSWIDLHVRPRVMPDIATPETTVSLSDPLPKQLEIRSSPEWKNAFYVVLLGFSGQGPPVIFPTGDPLWMVLDGGTNGFIQAINGPVLQNFGGLLDATGGARCTLNFAPIAPFRSTVAGRYVQVAPTFFTFERGFEPGIPVRLRFR